MEFIPDIAAKRAELTPDRIAFVDEDRQGEATTYGQLNDRATAFASLLRDRGLAPGDRIAILCHNSVAFFEILLGCAKAGVILVPLNWRQPSPELLPILQDSGARWLLHDADNAQVAGELARAAALPLLSLAEYPDAIATASRQEFPPRWNTGQIWYLLYTSGTTGKPKAVIQTVGMALANFVNVTQAISLTGNDSSLNFLPLFHTAGINLYTLPIFMAGGRTHLLGKFDVEATLRLIAAGKLSVFFGVPAIYQAISLHPDFPATDFSKIRSWGCGGAPLPEPLIRLFAARGVTVCNGFGMTETGPTVFLMDAAGAATHIGSVGRPQLLTEVKLVDENGEAVPAGQSGEIWMRGPNITPGYFNNPDATKAAFSADGWLKSGDVGRCDANGYYYIVDRIKDMYISGGENVYPAEVEIVIYAFPGVLECAVLGVPDEKWGEVGCAYILPQPGSVIDTDRLRRHCRERLAGYKVPRDFRIIEDFPRTAAGKIRKHVLRGSHMPGR